MYLLLFSSKSPGVFSLYSYVRPKDTTDGATQLLDGAVKWGCEGQKLTGQDNNNEFYLLIGPLMASVEFKFLF